MGNYTPQYRKKSSSSLSRRWEDKSDDTWSRIGAGVIFVIRQIADGTFNGFTLTVVILIPILWMVSQSFQSWESSYELEEDSTDELEEDSTDDPEEDQTYDPEEEPSHKPVEYNLTDTLIGGVDRMYNLIARGFFKCVFYGSIVCVFFVSSVLAKIIFIMIAILGKSIHVVAYGKHAHISRNGKHIATKTTGVFLAVPFLDIVRQIPFPQDTTPIAYQPVHLPEKNVVPRQSGYWDAFSVSMPPFEESYTFTKQEGMDICYRIKIIFEEKYISAGNQILYKKTITELIHFHLQSYTANHDTDFLFLDERKQQLASMLLNVINYNISFKTTGYPKIFDLKVTNISQDINLTEIQRRIDAFEN